MAKKTAYPVVGTYKISKELKKAYKQLSDAEVLAWVQHEKLTFTPNENAAINRMRMCMALLYLHFPKEAPKPKAVSKYAAYTTESLIALAAEKSVPVEVCDNERIMRMRTIQALRAHGLIG